MSEYKKFVCEKCGKRLSNGEIVNNRVICGLVKCELKYSNFVKR